MAKKTKSQGRIGFAAKQFWQAFRGYDAIKNTRYRANRGTKRDPQRGSRAVELRPRPIDFGLPGVSAQQSSGGVDVKIAARPTLIGPGLSLPQPTTGNEATDQQIEDKWAEFSSDPDVSGQMDMREIQQQMVDALLFYGDCGIKITDRKVQFIDGSRINNPSGQHTGSESARFQNGVEISETGRPISYTIGERINGVVKDFETVPARDFIPFFRRMRPVQYRGIPELAPILNTLQDCDEYDRVEMIAAKVSASLSVAVKTRKFLRV